MEKSNIVDEITFLDIIGYSYELDGQNSWKILDEKGKNVGYIKITEEFRTYDTRVIRDFVRHMYIDSDIIHYDHSTSEGDELYDFDIKGFGKVFLSLGDRFVRKYGVDTKLLIRREDGSEEWSFGYKGSYCYRCRAMCSVRVGYKYKINGYDVYENAIYGNSRSNYDNIYDYTLGYSKDGERIETGLVGTAFSYEPTKLSVTERKINEDGETETLSEKYYEKDQSVEDFALEHGRVIELFNQLRYLTKEVLPFKRDILYEMMKNLIGLWGLEILFKEESIQLEKTA